jgi:hypothetical protein
MAATTRHYRTTHRALEALSHATIVGLTLATAAIHASLGGLLFTANAVGYATLALVYALPGPIGYVRWLVRLALLGFTTTTIAGWLAFGARFDLAYVDKGIEIVLVAFLLAEMWDLDGGPSGIVRRGRHVVAEIATAVRN